MPHLSRVQDAGHHKVLDRFRQLGAKRTCRRPRLIIADSSSQVSSSGLKINKCSMKFPRQISGTDFSREARIRIHGTMGASRQKRILPSNHNSSLSTCMHLVLYNLHHKYTKSYMYTQNESFYLRWQ
jgi:hypothetical protein